MNITVVDTDRTDASYRFLFGQMVVALDPIEAKLFYYDKIVWLFVIHVVYTSVARVDLGSSTTRMDIQFNVNAFVVNYVITASLIGTSLELLRFADLIVYI